MSGKTTSIMALFDHFNKKDEVLSIETTKKRTLFYDYGTITYHNNKWKTKIHVYTTTGQDFYIGTRPTVLKGLDGLILVVDSQESNYDRNVASWKELTSFFEEFLEKLPVVVCFNKQDLENKFSSMKFLHDIHFSKLKNRYVDFTTATTGDGVVRSFENELKLIMQNLSHSKLLINEGISYLNL